MEEICHVLTTKPHTEHGVVIVVLYVKFQNDRATEILWTNKIGRYVIYFMIFGRMSHIVTAPKGIYGRWWDHVHARSPFRQTWLKEALTEDVTLRDTKVHVLGLCHIRGSWAWCHAYTARYEIRLDQIPCHYHITVSSYLARRRLKSPASRLFTKPFIQGTDQRKHQSSAPLAFRKEFTGHRWIPRTKGQ